MASPWSLVCPGSRGLGFALAKRLLNTTDMPLLVTARQDADAAKSKLLESADKSVDEKRLTVLQVDVRDEDSIKEAADKAASLFPRDTHHLDLAFAIPGMLHPEKAPTQIDAEKALLTLQINILGPMLLMKHFTEFLPTKSSKFDVLRPAVFATMSARVGSTTDNRLGGWYSYRASKAGVTSLAKTLDQWLQTRSRDHAFSVALHPGTVKTDLSKDYWHSVKPEKLFEADFAAEKLLKVIENLRKKPEQARGKFWDHNGEEVPP